MRIAAILSLIVLIMAGAIACATETASPSQGILSAPTGDQTPVASTSPSGEATLAVPAPIAPPDRTGTAGPLPITGRENVYSVHIDLVPSKQVYLPGEEIQMELVLTNASQGEVEPVILSSLPSAVSLVRTGSFSGPTVPPGVVLPPAEAGKTGAVKTFPAGTGEKTLAKGEKLNYNLTWDQKDEYGNQVSPGWYNYESICYYRPESSENNVGSGVGNRAFLIQYPQGAMIKTIAVNQSQTVNGLPLVSPTGETRPVDVVITLERVELNEMEATFYATMTSPDNPVSGYKNFEWLSHVPLSAQFVVDGVVKEARAPNSKFLDTGIEFRWGASLDDDNYLDPVPSDAKELTFVISEIKPDWKGPWEFKIPLESELPFEAKMNTSPVRFLPEEDVRYGISIRNLSSNKLTIDPFSPAMSIKLVGQNEAVYSRTAGNRTLDIGTDQTNSWYHTKGVWDQKDNLGKQVAPGWYEISYEYMIIEQNTGKRFTANPTARFEIVNPDSAMNKNLDVNQSVTAENITVTLKSIEMNAVETKLYIFTTPQGYSLTKDHPPHQMESLMTNSMAEYSVDGGVVKQVKSGGGKADAEGITLTWNNLDPVSLDAQEITFTITQLGDLTGRWEFKVKLN